MSAAADDFESLFDEISAQRDQPDEPAAAAPVVLSAVASIAAIPAESTVKSNRESDAEAASSSADPAEKPMFERLGGIVRLLHDSLRELGYDRSLSTVATQITDAQDRLEYVASLTEQAANKVLNAIDVGMPEQDKLAKQAKDMEQRWDALFEGRMSIDEFKMLAGDSKQFANTVADATDAEKARLLEIMMAQDFQDITGQLIKKIVVITHTAEAELAQLLRDNAPPETKAALAAVEQKSAAQQQQELMNGPSGPSAMEQDDVDSLLADLGF